MKQQGGRRVPAGILKTLRRGADEIKAEVDKDNEVGFPILNAIILCFIALVLYLIWEKLNERIEPTKKQGVGFGGATSSASSSPTIFSSSGPGYLFGGSKGKDY